MLLKVTAFILSPLLFAQGRYVRRVVPVLPEPEGPRSGRQGQGRPLKLLILGDSAAAGVGAGSQQEALSGCLVDTLSERYSLNWRLLAKTGHTTQDTIELIHQQPADPHDVVVVSLGVNDVTTGVSLSRWLQQQGELVALLNEKFSSPQILLLQLPPMGVFPSLPQPLRWYLGALSQQFNQARSQWHGSQNGCQLLEFQVPVTRDIIASDGFHPAPPFYQLWSQAIASKIERF